MNDHIYYQRGNIFTIIPNITNRDKKELNKYISTLKKNYFDKNGDYTFFWTIDKDSNMISVDETVNAISTDIRDQIIQVASFIFKKGYKIKGNFLLRLPEIIEHIQFDGITQIVKFLVLIDPCQTTKLDKTNDVMNHALDKMNSILNLQNDLNTNNNNKIIIMDMPSDNTEETINKLYLVKNKNTNTVYGEFSASSPERATGLAIVEYLKALEEKKKPFPNRLNLYIDEKINNVTKQYNCNLFKNDLLEIYKDINYKNIVLTTHSEMNNMEVDSQWLETDSTSISTSTSESNSIQPQKTSNDLNLEKKLDSITSRIETLSIMNTVGLIFIFSFMMGLWSWTIIVR